jgi:hypothetical protein
MDETKELLGIPKRDELLEEVVKLMVIAQDHRKKHLEEKWRKAEDLHECKDHPDYTGQSRTNRSHIFVPAIFQQDTELNQEVLDAFDGLRIPISPGSGARSDVIAAEIMTELFHIHLEMNDHPTADSSAWARFIWATAHFANVKSYTAAKWYWDNGLDRLGFDPILEDLFIDPRAHLTRAPHWFIHRIFREASSVVEMIEAGRWKGKDDSGRVVDFDLLKSAALVEEDEERTNRYEEEIDPFSHLEGKEDLLELWEYWCLRGSTWYKALTVKGAYTLEDSHVAPEGPLFQPFPIGYTIPRAGHLDGESVPYRSRDLVLELNKNRNLDIDGRNRELDPRVIASRRAAINLKQWTENSDLVMSNRVGPDVIQEFKHAPTVQAMVPRDAITMRDLHGVTGRTPPTQGKAEGSVRGSQGIGILSQNAKAPLTRRLKTFWATFIHPGLVRAVHLIRTYETDEERILEAARRAGHDQIVAQFGAEAIIQLLDRAHYYVDRDPDMTRMDAEGYERLTMQGAQIAGQAGRTDVALKLLSDFFKAKGFRGIASRFLEPMNPAMLGPQGPGQAAPAPTGAMGGMTRAAGG